MCNCNEELVALRAERDALKEALKPFARYADIAYRTLNDEVTALATTSNMDDAKVMVGDFRRARDVLKAKRP